MKQRSKALLAFLAASPAAAAAAEPPLKTLPSQQDIWITGTIQRGHGQYAPGDYTTLRLDRPSNSPCNDKVVTDIVLGMAGVPEPLLRIFGGARRQHPARSRAVGPAATAKAAGICALPIQG
ncbi:hypothetical protein AWB81_07823 [Caballeronia arationis]|uniref:hypothetical protein n=1 Tax=Caballeronia arationis TaxID=1777142 RepID=UPI00074B71CC|nr:hypothetical protein [Caballeronia arationis]SAL06921.1 hypothetical protein AWB81_07823 [Caballeronia arationis]